VTQVAPQTLDVVGRELASTLGEARGLLERFVEQPDEIALLERCSEELHRAQGVLRVLEIYGAALLAEEMEQVTRFLLSEPDRRNDAESLDALLRAMVQLPGYLDRVLAGGRDLALVLLPLLNDLRAVRGSPLLSEGTLLLLNLNSAEKPMRLPMPASEPQLSVTQWARRMRAQFQLGLVGWIRGEKIEQHLSNLAQVAQRMQEVATQQPLFQLWWVVGAVIEALREGGLEGGVSIKRLLGLADRELKRLHDQEELRYCQTPPVELLNNLLYYVARASSTGPRVSAVRRSFRLDELLPVDQSIDEQRETLSGPSIKLMQTVGAAIREDLGKVKDSLDIFLRRGGGQPGELAPPLELLRKIGDTLGVLGLGELRAGIQAEVARLEDLVAGRVAVSEPLLVSIATTLIGVEDRLENSLLRMIVPARDGAGTGASGTGPPEEPPSEEFLHVQAAVLRECIVNLAHIKETISHNVGGTLDAAGLDGWPDLMRGIKAGLIMLGRTRAVGVLDGIATALRRVLRPGSSGVAASLLDRLADAIVSVEYYMETLEAGRAEPGYMLDNAQACLDTLLATPEAIAPTVVPLPPTSFAQTVRIEQLAAGGVVPAPAPAPVEGGAVAPDEALESASVPPVFEPGATIPPVLAPAARPRLPALEPSDVVDAELIAIFIEEAREEVARSTRSYREWERNPDDVESLRTVRRSFHTLKGSGRMVRARELAEFAWALENLLNRLLDGTMERTAEVSGMLREGVAMAPQLVDHLAGGPEVREDVPGFVARAHGLAAGQSEAARTGTWQFPQPPVILSGLLPEAPQAVATGPTAEEPVADERLAVAAAEAVEVAPAMAGGEAPPEVTPPATVLHQIYERETDAHVATVRSFITEERRRGGTLHRLTEAVYRACHTLSGSSKMAEARHGVRLAEPLDHWLRRAWDSGAGLVDADLGLLEDCMDAMQQVARHPGESTLFFIAHEPLLERIAAAEADLQQRMAAALPSVVAAPEPESEPVTAPEASVADETGAEPFDAEIAGIFTEEATELLESAQAALQRWADGAGAGAALADLKRPLHTLKGGARLSGARAIGDLAHGIETVIDRIERGEVPADDNARAALQAGIDALAQMREQLGDGINPAPSADVMERLRSLGATAVLPEVAAPAEPSTAAAVVQEDEVAEPSGFEPLPVAEIAEIAEVAEVAAEAPAAGSPVPPASALLPGLAVPPGREPVPQAGRPEMARVDAGLLDELLNIAGEASIGRARLEQQMVSLDHNLGELSRTVTRLKDQLRNLEIETEKQILHRYESESAQRSDFDPLELDRYSSIQQFSRALAETASDVGSIQQLLETLTQDTQGLLQQQARVVTELQNGLMRTRMVPFQRHVQRLSRIVRQAATDTGKRVELQVHGASGELDRQVLERMLPPFEHILRNAVVHGIESPARRLALGKEETGRVSLSLRREGSEVVIEIADDGAGLDLAAIRAKAVELGLVEPADRVITDREAMQLVLAPGVSTADRLTQHAGRGVGMDIVAAEVKKLGGSLQIESRAGEGSRFLIRLPFTLATSHALVVRVDDELYALPLTTVEGVVRLPRAEVEEHLARGAASYEYSGQPYRLQRLGTFVGLPPSPLPPQNATVPVVLVRAGEHSTGLVTDELIGSREVVVKSVGPQIAAIRGISGATILGDGRIVIILDTPALVRADWQARIPAPVTVAPQEAQLVALVVDDSITVRRVTQRLLERNGMRVLTARDGLDALALLAENLPDVILLDIEMPRMDGYEVAAQVRRDPRTARIPIIMITSRVGEKHRARAIELGVDDYLGKPYQESQLLEAIEPLVARRRAEAAGSVAGTA
jgi:chemosensory pili system protein ChpA (sensor histidine kinase/response regulator)